MHPKVSKTLVIMSIRLVKLLSEIHIVAIHIDRPLNLSEIMLKKLIIVHGHYVNQACKTSI